MKRRYFFLFFLIAGIFISGKVFAQSNAVIDKLLNEKTADFGRSAYMVLSAASLMSDSSDISKTLGFLEKEQWKGLSKKKQNDNITLGEYSYLITKAFDIPGGIMYHLFPGPRYAVRELKYMGFVDNNSDPGALVSGDAVVRILGYVLDWKDGQK